jgi:hypothetical protein
MAPRRSYPPPCGEGRMPAMITDGPPPRRDAYANPANAAAMSPRVASTLPTRGRVKRGAAAFFAAFTSHDVKQPMLRRPLTIRARAPRIPFSFPPTRGSRAPRRRGVLARHPWHAVRLARRDACEAPRVPLRSGTRALSALHRGDFGLRVRASGFGILLRNACSDAPRGRVLVSGERFPCLPGLQLRAAAAEHHSPLRLQNVSGDAPHERG